MAARRASCWRDDNLELFATRHPKRANSAIPIHLSLPES